MKLINVEQIVTMELFDEEHEEYYKKKISIEDMITTYTTEIELPTVDAVPVKHGKWIYHIDDLFPSESTQECSVCHEHECITLCHENYCPNCGARMDKE